MADATDTSATDATDSTDTTDTQGSDATLGAAGEKALGEFKTRARSAEKALKATQAELEQLRTDSMSEQEQKVAEARKLGRTEALQQAGSRLVDAEIRVAGHGRTFDTDALLALDRSTFLTEDGDTDAEAIKAWVAENSVEAVKAEDDDPKGPLDGLAGLDLGQGSRANTPIGDDKAFEKMLFKAAGGAG